MEKFARKCQAEIDANIRTAKPGVDSTKKTTVEEFARAHGYPFRYDVKYVRAVSAFCTSRPEAIGIEADLTED